jgi:hypothetical protein
MKLLQINYRLNSSISDFMRASEPVAAAIADVPGLQWKIWLTNGAVDEGGGIYLFEDAASRQGYIDGPIIAKLRSHPAVVEVSIKEFDISTELSSITRAPI